MAMAVRGILLSHPWTPFVRFWYSSVDRLYNTVQKSGKGFGTPPNPTPNPKPKKGSDGIVSPAPSPKRPAFSAPAEDEDDVIPEVVTNRMLKRLWITTEIPMVIGVLFFPLFYFLKVVQKIDVPEWLPLITSAVTFGAAGLGISYGVISASWNPNREGSLLGWKEAQLNWPVLWENVKRDKDEK